MEDSSAREGQPSPADLDYLCKHDDPRVTSQLPALYLRRAKAGYGDFS
jgi:hypothetical protein